jgi:hypothetical protein
MMGAVNTPMLRNKNGNDRNRSALSFERGCGVRRRSCAAIWTLLNTSTVRAPGSSASLTLPTNPAADEQTLLD